MIRKDEVHAEQRRKFSPQFRAEAVQMVIETGKPIAEVARDLRIHDGTLGNWVNACRRDHPEPDQAFQQSFPTRARARFAVADYIEVSCNRKRLHSTLGYRTLAEAFASYQTAATAA